MRILKSFRRMLCAQFNPILHYFTRYSEIVNLWTIDQVYISYIYAEICIDKEYSYIWYNFLACCIADYIDIAPGSELSEQTRSF